MGLIIDTNVLIRAERGRQSVDFSRWAEHGDAFISAITASELLTGVHRAEDGITSRKEPHAKPRRREEESISQRRKERKGRGVGQ